MQRHRMNAPAPRLVLLFGTTLLLAGCESGALTRTFGLTRDAPDEFTVTTRAPLSMPPDFNLRPPRPGAPRPQEQSEQSQAEEILVPQTALSGQRSGAASPGQAALLNQTGPSAPTDIRRKVDADARNDQSDDGFVDKRLYWRKADANKSLVDPDGEAKRLRDNAALGQPATSGETAVIQQRRQGWFQKLFGWM